MLGRTNTGGGGGGGGLNFQIIGGTTAPSNPKENMIWVDTDAKITSYAFSATEPTEPTDGMVWIYTEMSSGAEFNALKKNSIQVYPISVNQYISGAWEEKPSSLYQNGGWVKLAFLVPNEYQRVEYLESSGSQYINTGLKASGKYPFTITAQYASIAWSGSKDESWLFGDWITGYCYLAGFYQGKFCVAVGADNTTDRYELEADTNIHTFTVKADHYEYDGVTMPGVINWDRVPNRNQNILLCKSPHTEDAYLTRRIFRCEMFTLDGEKIRDFIPCYRKSDNVAGFWDRVEEKFYTNAGSGTFIVGADK